MHGPCQLSPPNEIKEVENSAPKSDNFGHNVTSLSDNLCHFPFPGTVSGGLGDENGCSAWQMGNCLTSYPLFYIKVMDKRRGVLLYYNTNTNTPYLWDPNNRK